MKVQSFSLVLQAYSRKVNFYKREKSVVWHCFENVLPVALIRVVGSEVPNITWNGSAFKKPCGSIAFLRSEDGTVG